MLIETKRLLLRPYSIDIFPAYWSMLSEPSPEFPSRQSISKEDAWQRIMAAIGHWALFGYGVFAVVEKANGEYAGETGLMNMQRELGDRFKGCDEAGWYLTAKAQGRGLGFEAAAAAHQWYGLKIGKRSTFCIVDSVNRPSINLACRLGYEAQYAVTLGSDDLIILERTTMASGTKMRSLTIELWDDAGQEHAIY